MWSHICSCIYLLVNLLELQCMSVCLLCYFVNFDQGDVQCTHRMHNTLEGECEFKQMVRLSLGTKTERGKTELGVKFRNRKIKRIRKRRPQ